MLTPDPATDEARQLARRLGVSVTMADVLGRRGLDDDNVKRFLSPKLAELTPPGTMADRREAAERIAHAVRKHERIVVFGDYDCDGMTSTAILTDSLRVLDGDVRPLLASRFDGGYGLSAPALTRVLALRPKLVITCDCGSADHERIAAARDAGVDVVVIDHHLVPPEPLPALAFLNPHRPECGFPYKGLASCGLALSVAAAVRAELGATLDLRAYLDLVAVGTIADVAPLDGDNRALVRAGLTQLATAPRPGLRALAEYARFDTAVGVSAEDVSFRLAPRLNAPGRLGAPDAALEVLLARDITAARSAAAACEQANVRRRELQDRTIAEALDEVRRRGLASAPAIVLASEGWHYGIVGIVAGRLASQFGCPTVIAAVKDGVAHGSARSAGGIPIVTALGQCRELLTALGGHEKAAGLKFEARYAGELQEAFAAACVRAAADAIADAPRPSVRLDPSDEPYAVVRDFALLEPCGEKNLAPAICLVGAKVVDAREVKGGHLKLDLDADGRRLTGFGVQLGARARQIGGGRANVWGSLRRDTWRGGSAVEIRVDSLEPV